MGSGQVVKDPEPTEPLDAVAAPSRRAPFSVNPTLGTRGLRTQQRILDGALLVFGEHGYERTTIDKIGRVAGCSRVSIYQYFSDKHDVFRHLAGQVSRQQRASTEALEPLTPDADGWSALRAWVARYGDVYARYEPVFRAFSAASEADATLAGDSIRVQHRNVALFQSKLATTTLAPRTLEPVVWLALAGVTQAIDMSSILRSAAPDAWERDRVEEAITDVLHRCFFGLRPEVNAHRRAAAPPPMIPLGPGLAEAFARADALALEARQADRRALASLLEVGGDVVVRRGYRGTRVDDVVEAAGVSHGAFYRYFANKDDFVRVVAVRALAAMSSALADLPDDPARVPLRRWLRRYAAVHAEQAAMIRVWVSVVDELLHDDRAGVFDWGRRRAERLLRGRGFGDDPVDALVLLGFIEAFGARPTAPAALDAAVRVVEQAFLGVPR